MFAVIFNDGSQFSLSARQTALMLEDSTIQRVIRREAGILIHATNDWASDDGHSGTCEFTVVAPQPNGLAMIYQAGGPRL